MKANEQRGYIYQANNSWHCRFYVFANGVREQRSRFLCKIDAEHSSKTDHSVLKLAEDLLFSIREANEINKNQPHHNCTICGKRCPNNLQGKFVPKESTC